MPAVTAELQVSAQATAQALTSGNTQAAATAIAQATTLPAAQAQAQAIATAYAQGADQFLCTDTQRVLSLVCAE